jgi:hypothetical protein
MIELWTQMGVVVRRTGPKEVPGIPAEVFVEVQRGSLDFAAAKDID